MDLKQTAWEMAALYNNSSKVDAVLLAGSVARNLHDEHSDIELHIFWSSPPTDLERITPIKEIDGKILAYHPYEDEEWSESYVNPKGMKFEISSFLTETIERFVSDVVERWETDVDKQCLVASVEDGTPLFGQEKIRQIKQKIHYPVSLSERMVRENLWLGNRWQNRKALLEREDWIMLSRVLSDVQMNMMGALFGLNRLFVHHPLFKWMKVNIEKMEIKPEQLHTRMAFISSACPEEGVEAMEALLTETIELIAEHYPDLSLEGQLEQAAFIKGVR